MAFGLLTLRLRVLPKLGCMGAGLWLAWLAGGCGSRSNTRFQLRAGEPFDPLYEEPVSKRACANAGVGVGCGEVYASGTAVGGSFNFTDLFVRCQSSASGTTLALSNAFAAERATFKLNINLTQVAQPSGVYFCQGMELVTTPPTVEAKVGSCAMQIQVHDKYFAASADELCSLSITASSPIAGQIACSTLTDAGSGGDFSLALADTSVFACGE